MTAPAAQARPVGEPEFPVDHGGSGMPTPLVGMLLFIASEIMFFGGLFATYFNARASVGPGAWGPPEGAHVTGEAEHRTLVGWRDPDFEPAPGAPTPPACWRNPSGQIGGSAPTTGGPDAPSIDEPGTAAGLMASTSTETGRRRHCSAA